jgi:hypothetical protein
MSDASQLFNDRRLTPPHTVPEEAIYGTTYVELAHRLRHQYGEDYQKNRMLAKKGHLPGSHERVSQQEQVEAAAAFISDCTSSSTLVASLLQQLKEADPQAGQRIFVTVPLSVMDVESHNVLAPAFAEHVAIRLQEAIEQDPALAPFGISTVVSTDLCQLSKCDRTHAGTAGRIARQHLFGGKVTPGDFYIVTDDDLEMCSTAANASHYITQKGGRVIAVTAPAIVPGAHLLHLLPETKDALLSILERDDTLPNPHNVLRQELARFGLSPESPHTMTNNEGLLLWAAMADKSHDRPIFESLLQAAGTSLGDLERFQRDSGAKAQIHHAFDEPPISFPALISAAKAEIEGPNGRVVSQQASKYLG